MASDLDTLLKDKALYAKQLGPVERTWFTKRMLTFAAAQGSTGVLGRARELLERSRDLAKARLNKGRGSLIDDLQRAEMNVHRARIVYGALGVHPEIFLDGAGHDDLLDFILERRFRSIQRMLSYVNPNRTRKVFAYPPAGPITAQVSANARTLWEGVNVIDGEKKYPFRLTQAGKAKPREAIEKLFTKQPNLDDRTRVDCPAAAMCVHLDALLVAKNPDTLAQAMAAVGPDHLVVDNAIGPWRVVGGGGTGGFGGWVSKPSRVLTSPGPMVEIDVLGAGRSIRQGAHFDVVDGAARQPVEVSSVVRHTPLVENQVSIASSPLVESTVTVLQLPNPVGVGAHLADTPVPSFHAVSDPRPDQSLFEQVFIPAEDLQVGDHVYVANHPLHRSRLGNTIWNGEHSFVLDPRMGGISKMKVTGHGVTTLTVAQVVWIMLEEINGFLEVARKIINAWLAIPAGRTPAAHDVANDVFRRGLGAIMLLNGPAPFQGELFVFNLPGFEYQKSGKSTPYAAYWTMELEGNLGADAIGRTSMLIFDYDPLSSKSKAWPAPPAKPSFTNRVALTRRKQLADLGLPDQKQFAVSYVDDNAGIQVHMPLYHPVGDRKGEPLRLGYPDIQDSVVMGAAGPGGEKLFVTRPRVRATPAYLAFLKTVGAIA